MKGFSKDAVGALVLASIAATLIGCEAYLPIAIPAGAQVVHALIEGDEIRLEPATAHPGDVYLVVDTPNTAVVFIQGMPGPDASAGPLSDEQVDDLAARSSTAQTSITCCYMNDARGGASARLSLAAGKYALLIDDPSRLLDPEGGPIPSGAMAVLEVAP